MINYGDTLVLIEDNKPKQLITVTLAATYQNKAGAYHHASFVGKSHGEIIHSKNFTGHIQLLKPTPYLITETIPHKTQILFLADISLIILKLNIKPGSIVVESGTGSGSLSSSIASAVGPKGKLYTFEFNEDRAKNGEMMLGKLNFPQAICIHRDVYGQGFLKEDHDDSKTFPSEGTVDAIFLDLPQPWLALQHAKRVIKRGGKICCFSPCIEQVQKTVQQLRADGWLEVSTLECLKREYERRSKTEFQLFEEIQKKVCSEQSKQEKKVYYSAGVNMAHGHTGYLTYAQFI